MEETVLKRMSQLVERVFNESRPCIDPYKIWIFKDICAVADFSYKDFRFALDFFAEVGGLKVAFTPRASKNHISAVCEKFAVKNTVCDAQREEDAFSHALTFIRDIKFLIDLFDDTSRMSGGSKNVGVLTLPLNNNIGGNLQCYAMMSLSKRIGHKPTLLNRAHSPENYKFNEVEFKARKVSDTNFWPMRNSPNTRFIEKHIAPYTARFYSSEELTLGAADLGLDALVIGSDQVWRPMYARGILNDLYGKFLEKSQNGVKKISYGASFGAEKWEYSDKENEEAKRLLKDFSAVSVREADAVEKCKTHFEVDAQHVLDPTLLLAIEDYKEVFSSISPIERDTVVTYILDSSPDKMKLVSEFSKILNTKAFTTKGIEIKGGIFSDKYDGDATVERWLSSIYHSKFVITDSFHGVVFSILFNKPFIAYGNQGRGISRFKSILSSFGLSDRLIYNFESADMELLLRPIDWGAVNLCLSELRATSYKFLKDALSFSPEKISALDNWPNPLGTLCTGCGSCAAAPNSGLKMAWTSEGFLLPRKTGETYDESVKKLCPFNPAPEEEVRDEDQLAKIFLADAAHRHPIVGNFEKCYVGYSEAHRETSSSGGLGSYFLQAALEYGVADSVYSIRGDKDRGYEYQFITRENPITDISKTRYYPVTLEDLFGKIDSGKGKVALTGVGCFIKAVRIRQKYDETFRRKVSFVVGLICGGKKSEYFSAYLAQRAGVVGGYKEPEYRLKNVESTANNYSFSAKDKSGRVFSMPMRTVGDMWGTGYFKSRACDFCTDGTTELADISLGDAWLPEYNVDGKGHNIVVTRSKVAELLLEIGVKNGALKMESVPADKVVASQRGGISHKQNGLAFRSYQAKHHSNIAIPAVRKRFEVKVSAIAAVVYLMRERVRSRSLQKWPESHDAKHFERKMRKARELLSAVTVYRDKHHAEASQILYRQAQDVDLKVEISPELARLRPIARWLRTQIRNEQISLADLSSVIQELK